MQQKLSIAIAGSTEYTAKLAAALFSDARFEVSWMLTSQPKPMGRKQILTANPLHLFAQEKQLTTVLLNKKIDSEIRQQIDQLDADRVIDYLLVVDFGYLIPDWLLKLPKKQPLNVHPSQLPRWRGTSPGQFAILSGEKTSSVSLMIMNQFFDQGPVIKQIEFDSTGLDQFSYYDLAFDLIAAKLGDLISQYDQGLLQAIDQPEISPTPLSGRIDKADCYLDWQILVKNLAKSKSRSPLSSENLLLSQKILNQELAKNQKPLLTQVLNSIDEPFQAVVIDRACRAFARWPGVWTEINLTHTASLANNHKRLKLLSCQLTQEQGQIKVLPELVQIEGKNPCKWNEIRANLIKM